MCEVWYCKSVLCCGGHPEKYVEVLLLQLELTFNELIVLPFTSLGCVTWFFLLMMKQLVIAQGLCPLAHLLKDTCTF